MKHLTFSSRFGLALACGLVVSSSIWVSPARADQFDKRTILTVRDEPIQIRETVLQPGEYVLRLLDSQSDRHVVQIFNRDQTHIINTVLAVPAMRLEPTGHTKFTFWETPQGSAKAMRDWYYPGDNFGQEFPYPKHLQQIAMVTSASAGVAAGATEESNSSSASTETTHQETQAQSEAQPVNPEPTPEQQPTELAQNTTPAPATPEPTTSTPSSEPRELPKTGSNYPLFGLGGAALLGLYGLLRFRSSKPVA